MPRILYQRAESAKQKRWGVVAKHIMQSRNLRRASLMTSEADEIRVPARRMELIASPSRNCQGRGEAHDSCPLDRQELPNYCCAGRD